MESEIIYKAPPVSRVHVGVSIEIWDHPPTHLLHPSCQLCVPLTSSKMGSPDFLTHIVNALTGMRQLYRKTKKMKNKRVNFQKTVLWVCA